ncbi:tRNA 4-thiouridine(8) synthase ThiI [Candidatus Uhrbacteria bacterium]|nr:tRNA 4-thiouridine(8) synthase ThiI [Candidatus Uhrbacteria bacterium]
MSPVIVVHYHEIALKGRNRDQFEHQLIANIRRALTGIPGVRVARMSGRIVVRLDSRQPQADSPKLREYLARVFGIANIQIGHEVRQEREALVEDAVNVVRHHFPLRHSEEPSDEESHSEDQHGPLVARCHGVRSLALLGMTKKVGRQSFAVRVKRGNKRYPATSQELEREIGAAIVEATGLAVDLEDPDLTVAIEIIEDTAFVLLEKIAGPGGLPTGSAGRVAVLISSGFDSPVAAWRVMKRGAEAILVHFHSAPYTSDASVRNVEEIALLLAAWQGPTSVITVPLIEFQKAVMIGAPHALRVLLYRRAMVRVAERIAHAMRAGALVTGENLGQVASQTLTNIGVVDAAATIPILRPLIGYDKQEIINAADVIGTAEISRRPYDDCCSLFVPEHPATAARLTEIEHVEQELGLLEWTQKLFDLRMARVMTSPSPAKHA